MGQKVIIALGSNLDDPAGNLGRAAAALTKLSVEPIDCSSVWTSVPEGFDEPVPDFCNAVVRMFFDGSPLGLLEKLQVIEMLFGRKRVAERYLSRRLDLDLIDWNGEMLDVPGLQLPHPRAAQRRFVLLPLKEVEPDYRFPGRPESLDELISQAPDNQMVRTTRLIPLA